MLQFFNQSIHSSLVQLTPPSVEPITLAQAKLQCRIDSDITADDALITGLIVAARKHAEFRQKRALVTQQWKYCLDTFPFFKSWSMLGSPITLPLPPVQTVDSVKYIDPAGNLDTLSTSLYSVDVFSQPARVCPVFSQPWPISNLYTPNSVQITFHCGYGLPSDSPATIPQTTIQAMLLMIGHWYRTREAVGDYGAEVPMAAEALLTVESFGGYW
jgi:uncharacterized phiE125 gp8 family phage protein